MFEFDSNSAVTLICFRRATLIQSINTIKFSTMYKNSRHYHKVTFNAILLRNFMFVLAKIISIKSTFLRQFHFFRQYDFSFSSRKNVTWFMLQAYYRTTY